MLELKSIPKYKPQIPVKFLSHCCHTHRVQTFLHSRLLSTSDFKCHSKYYINLKCSMQTACVISCQDTIVSIITYISLTNYCLYYILLHCHFTFKLHHFIHTINSDINIIINGR